MARIIQALAAIAAIFLVGHVAGAPTCATMMATPTRVTAYPFAPYVACLNSTALTSSLATQLAALAKGAAALHSMAPGEQAALDAVAAAAESNRRSVFAQYLDYYRAFHAARDKHFNFQGLPGITTIEVVRPILLSLRKNDAGQMEVYVIGTMTQTAVDGLRALPALSGEAATIPPHATLAAAVGKTLRLINGRDALEWAREQAALVATESASSNMNVAAAAYFQFKLSDVLDLASPAETYEFADGSGFTTLRWVYKPALPSGAKNRCDALTRGQADAAARRPSDGGETEALASPELLGGQPAFVAASGAAMRAALEHVAAIPDHAAPLDPRVVAQHAYEAAGVAAPATPPPESDSRRQAASPTVIRNNDFATTYIKQVDGRPVAVLRIKTFNPSVSIGPSGVVAAFLPFYRQIAELMNASAGVTDELLIDVSSNGGGYVALGELTLRTLDPDYNIDWQPNMGNTPPLVGVTDKNTMWYRSFLRPEQLQSSPMKTFYPSMLNGGFVYGETSPLQRDWFLPVETEAYTGAFQRPSLFRIAHGAPTPFHTVRVMSDGFCGSTCCNVMERIRRFGLKLASKVEMVGFGGDTTDSRFQMSVFCGGSVTQTSCGASQAGLRTNPFMTSTTSDSDFDATFVNTAWFANKHATEALQFEPKAFATRIVREWTAVGDGDDAHDRRVALAANLAAGEAANGGDAPEGDAHVPPFVSGASDFAIFGAAVMSAAAFLAAL